MVELAIAALEQVVRSTLGCGARGMVEQQAVPPYPLLLSRGDWSVFVTRPLSAGLLAGAALLLVIVLLPAVKHKREEAFVEE